MSAIEIQSVFTSNLNDDLSEIFAFVEHNSARLTVIKPKRKAM